MSPTIHRLLFITFCACTLLFCIRRDVQLEKQYTGDLRNRVVGARLQKDGRPPYFYKWNPRDKLRYYDPQNFDSLKVSNITATPFTHQLLYPIVELPQRSVSRVWLVAEYCFLLLTILLAFSVTQKSIQQWAVGGVSALFLLTSGWKGHIAAGQYYILIPALCMLFYYFSGNKKNLFFSFTAGILVALLVLIRPPAILFLAPFLFLWNKYPLRNRVLFSVAAALLLTIGLAGSQNRFFWNDFRHALREQLKSHQESGPAKQVNAADPGYTSWEGWDKNQVAADAAKHPFDFESEHGNLFVVIKHLFRVKFPVWVFTGVSLLCLLTLLFLFYKRTPGREMSLFTVSLLGFCLYMIGDLCSPFYRFQYNATQWLFPLVLAAAHYHHHYQKIYGVMIAGLLLNILEIGQIGFEHTLGEYLILFAVLILAFRYRSPDQQIQQTPVEIGKKYKRNTAQQE